MLRLLVLSAVTLAFISPAVAIDPRALGGAWSYHWGDLPRPDARTALMTEGWRETPAFAVAPGSSPDSILWERLPIPAGNWSDPSILLKSVGGAFEAYSKGRRIYASGTVNPDGRESLETNSWHLIPLTPADLGGELVIRAQSSVAFPGVQTSAVVGSRGDLLLRIVRSDGSTVVVTLLLFAIGIVAFAAWSRNRSDWALLAIASVGFDSGVILMGTAAPMLLLFPWPIVLFRATRAGVCLFGPAFVWSMAGVFPSFRSRTMQQVLKVYAVFSTVAALLMAIDATGNEGTFRICLVLTLGSLVGGVTFCARSTRRGDRSAGILGLGFAALFSAGTWDTLPLFGLRAAGGSSVTPWGFLAVICAFAAVLVHRSSLVVAELAARTRHLEQRQKEILDYTNRVETGAREFVSVADALRQSGLDHSASIQRQAASLQETQVTAEEIRRTSTLAAEKAGKIMEAATEGDVAGRAGEAAVSESLGELEAIKGEVREMAQRISAAGAKASEIASIVSSVKDLADQSGVLALNAEIEAMRSGEAGRGFSLVAREVRRLADESVTAMAQIRSVLDGLREAVSGAVSVSERGEKRVTASLQQMQASGQKMQQLGAIVRQTTGHVRQISSAVTQQNTGVTQIAVAVKDLSTQMQETMDRARKSEVLAVRVHEIVAQLREGMNGESAAR